MTNAKRIAALAAGAGLLFAAAAVAQTLKPPAGVQVAGATQIDILNLRKDIDALKAENAALKSELSLVKSQVGNAVAVNVSQAQTLSALPGRLDGLERRFNRHTHLLRVNQFDGVTKSIARITTGEPAEFCATSGTNNFSCTPPAQP
jgi:hypothetical protein